MSRDTRHSHSVEVDTSLADALRLQEAGILTRSDVVAHVGFALADFGTRSDVLRMPAWIQADLVEWAREFEPTREWHFVSSAGFKDHSERGKKLYELVAESGLLGRQPG